MIGLVILMILWGKVNTMSLTRKHFNELAEIFKSLEPDKAIKSNAQAARHFVWEDLRERIAEFCAKHNSQFDYDRFMKASENDE